RIADGTLVYTDLSQRLAMALGVFGLISLQQIIGGVMGFAMMIALALLLGALLGDIRYHLLPATERPATSRWFEAPLLLRQLSASWSLRLLAVVFAFEIAFIAITQSYTFAPCSGLDLTRRFQGCAGVINHAAGLNDSAYAPNGRLLATTDRQGTVRLWSLPDRRLARILEDHSGEVVEGGSLLDSAMRSPDAYVSFSPDSAMLASSSPDTTIRLWNVADGTLLRTIPAATDDVRDLVFSPDGTLLASSSSDKLIRLWRVSDGTLLRTIETPDLVRSFSFNHDGTLLLSAEITNPLHLWQVQDGTLVRTINTAGWSDAVILSPDGQLIARADEAQTISLWRVSDGTLVRSFGQHGDDIQALAFSPDGTLLASGAGYDDRDVRLWRVSDGALVRSIDTDSPAWSLDFSPDGSLLVIRAYKGLSFWRIR
ncbi:MAG: WD40 repeat domain-containing protein, partial [Chloroflexi bacterium]|nr:WD40 repeat domain-containing protein [Chloroflexota bacterium]